MTESANNKRGMLIAARGIPMLIIALMYFCFTALPAQASSRAKDCLWIEFNDSIKEQDGSVTMPLAIHFGQFPDEKKTMPSFARITALYAFVDEEGQNVRRFHEAEIEESDGCLNMRVSAASATRFLVLVEVQRVEEGITYTYLAKTSFYLFGHSFPDRQKELPVSSQIIDRHCEISITPEFSYWPQTGQAVEIALSSKQTNSAMWIYDQNVSPATALTDNHGRYTYTPANDKKLNRQSETAYKQAVIVAQDTSSATQYISTYTLLLHRSRYGNQSLHLGAVLFVGTALGTILFSSVTRGRFRP